MTINPQGAPERWLHSCDLCWSLDYERIEEGGSPVHICRVCGLAQRPEHGNDPPAAEKRLDLRPFAGALTRLAGRVDDRTQLRMLMIGPDDPMLRSRFDRAGIDIVQHDGDISAAVFPPETFDIILATRRLERVNSPAHLFARSRLWLRPEGLLVVGGVNWEGLERRLWTSRWLRHYRHGRVYLGYSHVKAYATRYGFEVLTSGTRSDFHSISRIGLGSDTPLVRMILLPLELVSLLPRLGSTWWGLLVKRDIATAPIYDDATEEAIEGSTGLAPAGSYFVPMDVAAENAVKRNAGLTPDGFPHANLFRQ